MSAVLFVTWKETNAFGFWLIYNGILGRRGEKGRI